MSCPPDTDEKRLARFFLYRKVKNLWKHATKGVVGSAIVLAGDEASEVGCLRHYLELPSDRVLFVDVEEAGLEEARKLWRSAQTFHGEVKDAIASTRNKICFLNLDFCGYMKQERIDAVAAAKDRIAQHGIVAYTFCADRESAVTPNWGLVEKTARQAIASDPRFRSLKVGSEDWLDTVRFIGYSEILKNQLGRNFEMVFRMRYHTSRNMGVIALQNVPPHLRVPAWRKEVAAKRSFEERVERIHSVDLKTKLRDVAMTLTELLPVRSVAQVLHLPTTSIAAWQAHKTRGTYRRQAEK